MTIEEIRKFNKFNMSDEFITDIIEIISKSFNVIITDRIDGLTTYRIQDRVSIVNQLLEFFIENSNLYVYDINNDNGFLIIRCKGSLK